MFFNSMCRNNRKNKLSVFQIILTKILYKKKGLALYFNLLDPINRILEILCGYQRENRENYEKTLELDKMYDLFINSFYRTSPMNMSLLCFTNITLPCTRYALCVV